MPQEACRNISKHLKSSAVIIKQFKINFITPEATKLTEDHFKLNLRKGWKSPPPDQRRQLHVVIFRINFDLRKRKFLSTTQMSEYLDIYLIICRN